MTGRRGPLWGTEIAFRLGAGTGDEARSFAGTLAALAEGCVEHVLFIDEDTGGHGCLAVWPTEEAAIGYGALPAVGSVLDRLEELTGRRPQVRRYRMEWQTPAG